MMLMLKIEHGVSGLCNFARFISVKRQIAELKAKRKPVVLGDLQEWTMRGSGPGGQAVSKTSNSICLLHRESGIQVRSHKTRSLELNRKDAYKLMYAALDERINGLSSLSNLKQMQLREQKRQRRRKQQDE